MIYLYLFSFIQIVLESFPVSSSGHLRLLEKIFNVPSNTIPLNYLYHALHLFTACIILLFFWQQYKKKRYEVFFAHTSLLSVVIPGTMLCTAITLLFYVLWKYCTVQFSISCGFFITALILYSLRFTTSTFQYSCTHMHFVALGFVQGISLLPGISRMAATYTTLRWFRFQPAHALGISLAIELPLISVAALRALYFLCGTNFSIQLLNPYFLFVILGASISAWYGLQMVAALADMHRLWWFSFYMLLPLALSLFA